MLFHQNPYQMIRNRLGSVPTPVVRFAPGLWEKMCASVGALEPEHYAILGGHLDNPFYVTDLMPMPPPLDARGEWRSSSGTVTLNGHFVEYYLNTSLLPFGKYILGVMHSHPGGFNELSGGAPGSGYGDIPSMRMQLQRAAEYGEPWHNFIAPIVTYPGPSPVVDTYILRLDTPRPIRAKTVWESAPEPEAMSAEDLDILELARHRPDLVLALLQTGRSMAGIRSHWPREQRKARLLMQRLSQRQRRNAG